MPPRSLSLRAMRVRFLPLLIAAVALAGCGSSSSAVSTPTVGAAKTFNVADFQPSGLVTPGKSTTVSFHINKPNGKPLTRFKQGPGPHTGVHLIMVRNDLSQIIHRHPPIAPDGTIRETVKFPSAGPWHVLIDVYPNVPGAGPNFQLTKSIVASGAYKPKPIGTFKPTVHAGPYTIEIHNPPKLKALLPAQLNMTVTGPGGKKAVFTPWYGALAHAIFFQDGTLNYFHTHVCAAGMTGCTSILGGAKVTGQSNTPGRLKVGVLLPVAGTWRLFLQTKIDGKVITAPFTLKAT
jgi:hypothetical protein